MGQQSQRWLALCPKLLPVSVLPAAESPHPWLDTVTQAMLHSPGVVG